MNPNTRVRLWKEGMALLPFWVAMAGMMAVPLLLTCRTPLAFAHAAYVFGCALLGSVVIGQEFQHRTMGALLAQPVSRRRIWWEKMTVLGTALLGLLLWLVVLGVAEMEFVREPFAFDPGTQTARLEEVRQLQDVFLPWTEGLVGFAYLLLPLLVGFATGPTLTLLARGTIGGVALTFLCPWALSLPVWFFMPDNEAFKTGQFTSGEITAVFLCLFVAPSAYVGGLFLLGCRRFRGWEDAHAQVVELSLPPLLTKSFTSFTERLTLRSGGVLGRLFRKEARLQLPAFVVAGMLVGLWLLLLALVFARPSVVMEVLMLPAVLLGLGIPVIVGIVSTAEERNLGLLDWHLTLPVSARLQWFVKVLVALGTNMVLGILLPGVLGQISSVLLEGKSMELGLRNGEQHFLIANAVIFCAALYASTASTNGIRALVGTTVLFIGGAMVLNFADLIVARHPETVYFNTNHGHTSAPVSVGWLYHYRWLIGWSYLAVCLYLLGLENFRRSLESLRQPVRQMAWFFALVFLFVAWAIDW